MNLLSQLGQIVKAEDLLLTKDEQAYACRDQATNVEECWPLAVVRVNSVQDLIDSVQTCLHHRAPIVMRGAGSGKSGGAVPVANSIVIDVTRLNKILLIDKENLLAEVEPGVVLADLQAAVNACDLYYPPDPASSAYCTIGGNVAENAAGPSTLKYGTTRDYVLGGQAILGTGEIIDFGKRCPKGVAGFDIAALLCGSEGSLAIFTKLILRLLPLPKSLAAATLFFADERLALCAVNIVLNSGFLPKTLEYIDTICLLALSQHCAIKIPDTAQAALIVECDASFINGGDDALDAICNLLKDHGLQLVVKAVDREARKDLWQARSQLSEACTQYLGYKLSEDIAVPLGAIADFCEQVKDISKSPSVKIGIFGHAGDGNLHVQIMFAHVGHKPLAQALRHELLLLVLRLKGTITAEHGVGLQKKAYLPLEQSPVLIALQKRIKTAFDPHHLLNPGKIFD